MNYRIILFYLFQLTFLSACSDSSSSKMGIFSMSVSDAPNDAQIVNISFKQVVLKGSDGSYTFDVSNDGEYQDIDLVSVSGLKVGNLVENELINVGEYQLCIYMQNNEQEGVTDSSYVKEPEIDGGMIVGLSTPSEGACGGGVGADDPDTGRLFINKKFTVSEGENSYILEFDLNKVLMEPTGQDTFWTLKPTGIELIEAGSIAGTISYTCGGNPHSVYLYPGDVEIDKMADFRSVYTDAIAPLDKVEATAIDPDNTESAYTYEFPAIYAGTYSLAYACPADDDLIADDIATGNVIFNLAEQVVEVVIASTTTVDFVDIEEDVVQ